MTQTTRRLVKLAYPDYRGRRIQEDRSGSVHFYGLNWDGGCRNYFTAVQLSTGRSRELHVPAPWDNPVEGQTVRIPPGIAVVEHSYSGQYQSVTVHYPAPAPELGPASLPE